MKKIAIFASGSGSNAENIIQYFLSKPEISVDSVFCNVAEAYVLKRAEKYNIPTFLFNREDLKNQEKVLQILQERQIDFIVSAFPNRIINIHPALLPHHGGKGMYGMKVHEAVIAAGEKESGITIHYINNQYDKGDPIFQARCPVEAGETPESLAKKVHALEYAHFPRVIEEILQNLKS